ncbi:MAG: hypothetical protein HY876_00305 [Coriobacteriales bacterium]|nr:hypothetical protein [Coriobacteriales bacterium]
MRRYPLAIWAGIVFALALSASALYWDSSRIDLGADASWGTVATVNSEYRAATEQLSLPEGHKWPKATPYTDRAPDGAAYSYAAGVGREWAEWYWFGAWASVAVSSTEPTSVRQAAIDRLPEFYKTTAFSTTTEPGYYRRIITAAQKGDCDGLREYVEALDDSTGEGG